MFASSLTKTDEFTGLAQGEDGGHFRPTGLGVIGVTTASSDEAFLTPSTGIFSSPWRKKGIIN